jgi:hypothetical protein
VKRGSSSAGREESGALARPSRPRWGKKGQELKQGAYLLAGINNSKRLAKTTTELWRFFKPCASFTKKTFFEVKIAVWRRPGLFS